MIAAEGGQDSEKSSTGPARPQRLIVKIVLMLGIAGGLVSVGLPWWALVFAVVSVPLQFAER